VLDFAHRGSALSLRSVAGLVVLRRGSRFREWSVAAFAVLAVFSLVGIGAAQEGAGCGFDIAALHELSR